MAHEKSEKERQEEDLNRLRFTQLEAELSDCRKREEGYLDALQKKQVLLDQLEPERNALKAEVERLKHPRLADEKEEPHKSKH